MVVYFLAFHEAFYFRSLLASLGATRRAVAHQAVEVHPDVGGLR
jgi:hypothetical protein